MISISLSPGGAAIVPPPLRASMTNALSLIVCFGGARAQAALESATLAFPGAIRAPPVDALNCAITLAFIGSTATASSAHNLLSAFVRESPSNRNKLANMVPLKLPEETAEKLHGIEQSFGDAIVRELQLGESKGAAMAALVLRQFHDGLSSDQCVKLAKMLITRLVNSASDTSSQIACLRCLIAIGDRAYPRFVSDGPSIHVLVSVAKKNSTAAALSSQLAYILVGLCALWEDNLKNSSEPTSQSMLKKIETELGTTPLLSAWDGLQVLRNIIREHPWLDFGQDVRVLE